jgi:hypothetical protein
MIQSLWDGMKASFAEFIEWVRTIPSQIVAAIGRIDLSGMIKMPSLPSFLGGAQKPAQPVAGARAEGGPVSAGKRYLVGEKGPELFTPGASGSITPNGASGSGARAGSIVVSPTFNISGADPKIAEIDEFDRISQFWANSAENHSISCTRHCISATSSHLLNFRPISRSIPTNWNPTDSWRAIDPVERVVMRAITE